MKILITEDKRLMLFKTEFKYLFNNLTPTRNSWSLNIIYIYFDDINNNNDVTGLVYRPSNRELIIYMNYFMSLRAFVSSEDELGDLIRQLYTEITDKPVSYYEIVNDL